MGVEMTCKACGTVMKADTEDEMALLGQEHAKSHGHDRPMSRKAILARIRKHNPQAHQH